MEQIETMFTHPDFIRVPMQVAQDEQLLPSEKLLYGIILWFATTFAECKASDVFLAQLTRVSEDAVAHSLLKLEEKRYIRRVFFEGDPRFRLELVPLIHIKEQQESYRDGLREV